MAPIEVQRHMTTRTSPANRVSVGTTTERTLVLKQISQLQKAEAALGKKLLELGHDVGTMSERIELQHQIHSIDEQIKALQILLLQEDADRPVKAKENTEPPAGALIPRWGL